MRNAHEAFSLTTYRCDVILKDFFEIIIIKKQSLVGIEILRLLYKIYFETIWVKLYYYIIMYITVYAVIYCNKKIVKIVWHNYILLKYIHWSIYFCTNFKFIRLHFSGSRWNNHNRNQQLVIMITLFVIFLFISRSNLF